MIRSMSRFSGSSKTGDGRLTYLVLEDGRRFRSFNIAWGYDLGDTFAHVTGDDRSR